MGALCTPGTMVLTRLRCVPQPASAAFQRPVPNLGPVLHSFHPDLQDDEASTKGSLAFARPSFPFTRGPRKERGPFGLTPRAPHPAVTRSARQGGDRPSSTDRRSRHHRPLHDVIHSLHATSCRTRRVLPSKARTWRCSRTGTPSGRG